MSPAFSGTAITENPPEVVSAAYYYCNPQWTWRAHGFRDLDLWFAFDGEGFLENQDGVFRVSPGTGFLFSPGDSHTAWTKPENPLCVCAIHFTFPNPAGADTAGRNECRPDIPFSFHVRDHTLLMALLDRTIRYFHESRRDRVRRWFIPVLDYLADEAEAAGLRDRDFACRNRIETICAQIRQHPGMQYSVTALAEQLHMSPDHFSRLFKRAKGIGPNRYIVNSRIAYAKHLLSTSSAGIEETAGACGYATVQFFCRQFREITGYTPGRFRQTVRTRL